MISRISPVRPGKADHIKDAVDRQQETAPSGFAAWLDRRANNFFNPGAESTVTANVNRERTKTQVGLHAALAA